MRNFYVILTFFCFFFHSCSKDDNKKESDNVFSQIQGTWVYSGGTFSGNGINGTTDPYFYNTTLEFYGEPRDEIIQGKVQYPNSLEWSSLFIKMPKDKYMFDTFIDNGVKVSNVNRLYYYYTENLIPSSGEIIEIDLVQEFNIKSISETEMITTKEAEGYTIEYHFIKKR
ncbi:hypothetical protein C7S20_13755 [Christiangramia fulva]|uniref:Uncharacterized protein n=1 Tax=Christiangramia fulva TaxID=2126553 RepID=A0A2R3Z7I5_9FLAO|nr:hypothetical protein [Christiangramia fulva]AVR46240.1 hypothetical protein C7S20_13755 [Christiangramia fulva]